MWHNEHPNAGNRWSLIQHTRPKIMSEGIKLENQTNSPSGLPPVPLFAILTHGEPGEHWTGTEILARLDCKDSPWAHLRLDDGGWRQVIEDGDMGAICFETITHYVLLPTASPAPRNSGKCSRGCPHFFRHPTKPGPQSCSLWDGDLDGTHPYYLTDNICRPAIRLANDQAQRTASK